MKQLTLNLGRCQFMYKEDWQCTKWEGHEKKRGSKVHTALAPTGWHPDYAISLDGISNFINRSHVEMRYK